MPLHLAGQKGHVDVVGILVEIGSGVTVVDKKGRPVLHLAAKSRNRHLVEVLINQGSDINVNDSSGRTMLGAAAMPDLDVVLQDNDWNWHFLQTNLENGGDVNAVDFPTGRTTLHFAAECNSVSALNNLLNQRLRLEARDKKGETPLHRAAAHGATEVTQALVERGADFPAVNKKGQTPLLVSLGNRSSTEGSKMFLNRQNGNTALHYAVREHSVGQEEGEDDSHCKSSRESAVIEAIMNNGGDANAANVRGSTPLREAAYHGDAQALLKKHQYPLPRQTRKYTSSQGHQPISI